MDLSLKKGHSRAGRIIGGRHIENDFLINATIVGFTDNDALLWQMHVNGTFLLLRWIVMKWLSLLMK